MHIFPAIDLYQGKAVRLYKGDYEQVTISTMQGVAHQVKIVDGKADISAFDKGIYIYALDRNHVGKFVKK